MTLMGFEPQAFRPTVRRANRCATGAGQLFKVTLDGLLLRCVIFTLATPHQLWESDDSGQWNFVRENHLVLHFQLWSWRTQVYFVTLACGAVTS